VVPRLHGNAGPGGIPTRGAMVLREQAEGNRTRIERNQEMEKKIDNVSGHVVPEQGFRGREESVCLEGTQG
jgi:hypothetical protein